MAQYETGGHVRTLGPPQSLHHYYNLIMDKIDLSTWQHVFTSSESITLKSVR